MTLQTYRVQSLLLRQTRGWSPGSWISATGIYSFRYYMLNSYWAIFGSKGKKLRKGGEWEKIRQKEEKASPKSSLLVGAKFIILGEGGMGNNKIHLHDIYACKMRKKLYLGSLEDINTLPSAFEANAVLQN